MSTQSTKTFLQLVNATIDEAGTDLAQFAADGSDWNTNSDAMMNRFKKWVNRAWRELQQEANDWHWLDETAVITINPGIMFWSNLPIDSGMKNINPATIVDIDGSTQISGLQVDGIQDLTSRFFPDQRVFSSEDVMQTSTIGFGYMDIRYADYDPNSTAQGHVLDFGLKSGGFRITRENDGRVRFIITTNNPDAFTAAGFVSVGDEVQSITTKNNITSSSSIFGFTGGKVDSVSISGTYVTMQLSYTAVTGDFFSQLVSYATAAVSQFNIEFSVKISTTSGNKDITGGIRFDAIGNQFLLSGAISPLNYDVEFDAPVTAGPSIRNGDNITYIYSPTTHLGNPRTIISTIDASIKSIYPTGGAAGGILSLNVRSDSGISLDLTGIPNIYKTCWTLWTSLLFATAPVCKANLPGTMFFREDGYVDGGFLLGEGVLVALYDTGTSTDVGDFSFSYEQPYPYKNYIHGWKSFDWGEELGDDDFVGKVRSTDNSTFRIISREDAGVSREVPLIYMAWDEFQNKYDLASIPPATPRVISEDNSGRYRLYPPPDRPYTVVFDYIREPQELVLFTDVCRGLPAEWEDAVMWRALQMYGEYDEQPAVAGRGRINYKNMLLTMQQELRPAFHFKPHRMY